MYNVAVAGHICLDLTPALPLGIGMLPGNLYDIGGMASRPGGCIVNVGSALTGLGLAPKLWGAIGEDDFGEIVLREVERMGLRTEGILRSPEAHTSYSIVIEPAGMNRTFWHHTGANRSFDGRFVETDGTDLLHVGYPSLVPGLLTEGGAPLENVMRRARGEGVTTSLDLAVVDPDSAIGRLDWQGILDRALTEVDVMSPSVDDLTSALESGPVTSEQDLIALADELIAKGVAVVMVSAGEDGLLLRTAGAERLTQGGRVLQSLGTEWADVTVFVPAKECDEIATTNGAGDAATAGLLYGLAAGLSPTATGDFATTVAQRWIQQREVTAEELAAASSV
ncbi:carbohydrate kinase family protein [Brachybacterium paraconglomeratum]|uniref:carbohydrate kinase family protein n=1 Tax=Brachybacterium paraconglomeratum TaxID=173362 RepID=UPI0038798FCB